MNLTNYLLSIILFILVKQLYPDIFGTFILLGIVGLVLYGCYWLVAKFPTQWKKRKTEKQQEQKDETDYWEYRRKHDAVRAKFDPKNLWNEATSVPKEYLEEIENLNLEHRGMLQRRNGWTANDFNN